MSGCPECHFELLTVDDDGGWQYDESGWTGAVERVTRCSAEIAAMLRDLGDASCRARPSPDVWSPLEYACHVRDVLLVQRERVLRARRGHGGETQAMGRDERVEHDGYNDQEPGNVAVQVEQAAILFNGVLSRLSAEDWDREMTYNFPEAMPRSLRWVAVHTAHEVVHHLNDLRAQR